MLNGVKKADRLDRTIDGIMSQADDFEDLFRELLGNMFKGESEEFMKGWWELKEDIEQFDK